MEITKSKKVISNIIKELLDFFQENSYKKNILTLLKDKLDKNELNLTVLGEFNRGKSTFVNSLIGANILPSGLTPTTSSINILKYSTNSYLKAFYKNKSEKDFLLEKNTFDSLDYENINYLEIGSNSDFLKNIIIVDTPGVNDINEQKLEVTYNYIPNSDAVIFLLDAEQILSKSEFNFLQSKILTADIDKIIFVINKIDNLELTPDSLNNPIEEVIEYTKNKLSNYFSNPIIIPYSAKNALKYIVDNNKAALEKTNYPNLLKAIEENILEKKEAILIDRTTNNIINLIKKNINDLELDKSLFIKNIDELENNLNYIKNSKNDLEKKVEKLINSFEKDIKDIKETEKNNLREFSLELIKNIRKDFSEISYQDIKTYLHSFIQDKFKEQIESQEIEIKSIILKIYQKYMENLGKLFEDLKKELNLKVSFDNINLKGLNKTSNIDLLSSILLSTGLFAMFFTLIGGVLMLATGGFLALTSKEAREKSLKEDYINLANSSITDATEKITLKIEELIEQLSIKIQENLKNVFEEEFKNIENSINKALETKKSKEFEFSDFNEKILKDIEYLQSKHNLLINILEENSF
ncbi:MAG: dynamin family protein [Candidatus Sericytochromatia bacterium]